MYKKTLAMIMTNKTVLFSTVYFLIGTASSIILGAWYTKLEGLLVAVAVLAAFRTASSATGLLQPYLKRFTLKQVSLVMVVGEALDVCAFALLAYDTTVFVYAYLSMGVVLSVVYSTFGIKYDAYLSELGKDMYEEVQTMERVYFAMIGLIFGVVATGLYVLDERYAIGAGIVLSIITAGIGIYTYVKHWRYMQ